MGSFVKRTTGLTGLKVAKSPHLTLSHYYEKILYVLSQMPPEAFYRKSTEQIIKEKLHMVKSEPNIIKLEEKFNGDQVEEAILQAENELNLAKKFLDWKPWEELLENPPAKQWKWPIL